MSDEHFLALANQRIKELHEKLPEARVCVMDGEDPYRRWCVYSRLKFSLDGTTNEDTAVSAVCVVAQAPTWWEALARAHRVAEDPHALNHYRDRHIRGLPLEDEPPPLTETEKAAEADLRRKVQLQKERAIEGQRKHLRNLLKRQGLYDLAKKHHKKTGALPNLFGKMGDFFDFKGK